MPQDRKVASEKVFDTTTAYSYSGIFMGASEKVIPGVWIWGEKGPRFFRSDEDTVFSYFRMCVPEALEAIRARKRFSPSRTIDIDIAEWNKKIDAGNFVTVLSNVPGNGGNLGRLKEVFGYDWWVFNPAIPVDRQCEK